MDDDKEKEYKTIEVRGYHVGTSDDTLECYFENPRKGGGEIVGFQWNDQAGVVYITFADVEVAKNVVKKTHTIGKCVLQVKLHIPRPSYKDRLLITGLRDTTTKDCLINFLEVMGQCKIKDNVVYGDKEGAAVVIFDQIPNLEKLQEGCAKRSLERSKLTISKIPVSNIITVRGLKPTTNKDTVCDYFEGKRSGNVDGVAVEKVHMKSEEGCCLVYFENHAVIKQIVDVSKGHKFEGSTLDVSTYYECLYPREADYYQTSSSREAKNIHKETRASENPVFNAMAENVDPDRSDFAKAARRDLIIGNKSKIKIFEVDSAHFGAVKMCLVEQLIKKYIETSMLPSGKIRIKYKDLDTDREEEIHALIRDEIKLAGVTADDQKIKSVVKDLQDSTPEMFCAHIPEHQIIVMFGEDRNKLETVKRKIQAELGKMKKRSRANRIFSPKTTDSEEKGEIMSALQDQVSRSALAGLEPLVRGKLLDVMVYKGDITTLSVDAIVNAANEHLAHGAGVARAIASAAGDELDREGNTYVREHGSIPVSGVVATTAGRLHYKKVLHAVGPQKYMYADFTECLEVLCKTILRCLCEARKLNMSSVAIPSISSGIFGVPKQSCAEMYVRAVRSFNHVVNGGSLKEVHFVDISHTMLQLIKDEFVSKWDKRLNDEVLNRDQKFIKQCLSNGDVLGSSLSTRSFTTTAQYPTSTTSTSYAAAAAAGRSSGQSASSADARIQIIVYKEDIFRVDCEGIVCWISPSLLYTDFVIAQKIFHQAGDKYKKQLHEIRNHYWSDFHSGFVFLADGGNLHQRLIIHGVIDFVPPSLIVFKKMMSKIVSEVDQKKLSSVVIPVFQRFMSDSVKMFTETLCEVVKDFSKKNSHSTLKQIHVVDIDQKVVDRVLEIVKKSGVND